MIPKLNDPRLIRWAALGLLLMQGAHVFEHVLQTIQMYAWHHPHPHGLLGAAFDFEWLHFVFNAGVWLGLVLFLMMTARTEAYWTRTSASARAAFFGATALETYHVVEHIVRMKDLLLTGIEDRTGILGTFLHTVVLHLGFNLLVYVAMAPLVFVFLRTRPAATRVRPRPLPRVLGRGRVVAAPPTSARRSGARAFP